MNDLYLRDAWTGDLLSNGARIFEMEFRKIAEISEANGIPVYAALIPTRLSIRASQGDPAATDIDYSLPIARGRAILDAVGISYVDLLDPLVRMDIAIAFHEYDGHFTAEGNRVAAEAMLELMEK